MIRKSLAFTLLAVFSLTAFAAGQAKTVTIQAQDNLRFSVDHFTVQPGQKVTVKLVNKTKMPASAMSHNFVLLKSGVDPHVVDKAALGAKDNDYIPAKKSSDILAHTELVSGGHSDTVTFTAPSKTGDYTYICTFPGHFMAGMKGTMTVASGD